MKLCFYLFYYQLFQVISKKFLQESQEIQEIQRERSEEIKSLLNNQNEGEVQVSTYVGSEIRLTIDGIGSNSLFYYPQGITISNNEIFALVAEYSSSLIRKIILSTTFVTTLAGSSQGYQDGVGTNAMFYNPIDICITNDDNIAYVIEYNSPKIRKIDISTTIVTTLAGSSNGYQDGVGTNVKFKNPRSLTISPDNSYLLIADTYNYMIRKLIFSTNTVTTLAGNIVYGSIDGIGLNASFYNPRGIGISPDGTYCLISDSENFLIRKIIISTTEVTTLAGNNIYSSQAVNGFGTNVRLGLPIGIKITPNGLFAIISDSRFNMIRKVNISTGFVSTVSGGTSIGGTKVGFSNGIGTNALFNNPHGVYISKNGSYALITDIGTNLIRKIILSQYLVSTLVGRTLLDTVIGTNASFNRPSSISLSPDNTFALITDSSNYLIRYIDMSTSEVKKFVGRTTSGSSDGFGTNAAFHSPTGISISSNGEFALVTDRNNFRVRKIIISTTTVSTVAGLKFGLVNGIGTNARFGSMYDIAISIDDIYALIVDFENNQIRKLIISTTEVTTLVGRLTSGYNDGIGTNALFELPQGLTISADGIYALVTDSPNNIIRKIIITTAEVTTIVGNLQRGALNGIGTSATFYNPYGLSISPDNSYVELADSYNNRIRKIILSTLQVTTIAGRNKTGLINGIGTNSRFSGPSSVSFVKSGKYSLVVDSGNDCVRKLEIIKTIEENPTSLPTNLPTSMPNTNPDNKSKSDSNDLMDRKAVFIPVIICIILLFIGLILGIYLFYTKKINNKESENDKVSTTIQIPSDNSDKLSTVHSTEIQLGGV